MFNLTDTTWYTGKKPCKHCGKMTIKYRKWYDNPKEEMGKKYKCSNCHKEWWEQKYYNKEK